MTKQIRDCCNITNKYECDVSCVSNVVECCEILCPVMSVMLRNVTQSVVMCCMCSKVNVT